MRVWQMEWKTPTSVPGHCWTGLDGRIFVSSFEIVRGVRWPVKLPLSYYFIFSLFLYVPLWLKMSAGPDISETSANLSSRQLYLKAYKFWLNLIFPCIIIWCKYKRKKKKKHNKTKKNKTNPPKKNSKTPMPGCKSWRQKLEHWFLLLVGFGWSGW